MGLLVTLIGFQSGIKGDSAVLYTSQVLEGVKNDIFWLISSNLMSIFSPNIGHQEKIISKY